MNNFKKNQPKQHATPNLSSNNVLLAAGDETGPFEKNTDTDFHGVALVLARAEDWLDIASEKIGGETVRDRFTRPVQGLVQHLAEVYQRDSQRREKEVNKHHVLTAFDYFNWQKQLPGGLFDLAATSDDPVLLNLLESMRWLARHPKLLSIGIYGNGGELYQRLYRGDDPMAALGSLYGRLLAVAYPFLGNKPHLRLLLSGRSEIPGSFGVARAGVALPGSNRQPSHQTGGDRVNISFVQNSFWESLSTLQNDIDLPNGALPRQQALAAHSFPKQFKDQLGQEGINSPDTDMMKNLADLACGMMASLDPKSRDKKVCFNFGQQPGPNMRFFSIKDFLS